MVKSDSRRFRPRQSETREIWNSQGGQATIFSVMRRPARFRFRGGRGCSVKVEPDHELTKKDPGLAKGPRVKQKRALVVEDEPAMCALIQEALRSADIEAVTPAKNIEMDLLFFEEKFDVIVI